MASIGDEGKYFQDSRELIKSAYQLGEQLEKKLGKEKSIQDLFLLSTGQGLKFIAKESGRGHVEAIKAAVGRRFGKKSDALKIEQSLEKLSDLFAKIHKEVGHEALFAQAAKELGVENQALLRTVDSLLTHIQSLSHHVETKKIRKGTLFKNVILPKTLKEIGKSKKVWYDVAAEPQRFKKDLEQALRARIPAVEKDAAEALTQVALKNSEIREKLALFISTQDITYLRLLLVAGADDEETACIEDILRAHDKVEPEIKEELTIKQFGHVFGDSFLYGTGLEGDESCSLYFDLIQNFLQEQESKKAKELGEYIGAHIRLTADYTGAELQQDVRENIERFGKCLFAGGWEKHAITYEAIKQKNGKYTFRVYNAGEGAELQDFARTDYKEKISGMIEIRDIPEKNLFRKTFLSSLVQLRMLSKDATVPPKDLLYDSILPQLKGKFVTGGLDINELLSIQRSGTCTYRSVLASLRKAMPKEQYKLFKFQFKMYCLEQFLPRLESLAKSDVTSSSYQSIKRDAAVIQRGIEKFSSAIGKMEAALGLPELNRAKKYIAAASTLSKQLAKKIEAYEKAETVTITATGAQSATKIVVRYQSPFDPSMQQKPYSPGADLKYAEALTAIAEINVKSYASIKKAITAIENVEKEHAILLDSLFKKIGPLSSWKELATSMSTNEKIECLKFIEKLCKSQTQSMDTKNGNTVAPVLYLISAYELVFQSLPEKIKLVPPTSLLHGVDISNLRVDDPFWVQEMQDILVHAKPFENPFSYWNIDSIIYQQKFSLSSSMVDALSPSSVLRTLKTDVKFEVFVTTS